MTRLLKQNNSPYADGRQNVTRVYQKQAFLIHSRHAKIAGTILQEAQCVQPHKSVTASALLLVLISAPISAADVGDAQEAEKKLEQALSLSDARDASRRRQLLDEAAVLIQKVLAANSENAGNFLTYGNILYSQGKVAEAEQAIRKCIILDPKMVRAYGALGQLSLEKGNAEAAIAAYKQATEADPTYAGNHELVITYRYLPRPWQAVAVIGHYHRHKCSARNALLRHCWLQITVMPRNDILPIPEMARVEPLLFAEFGFSLSHACYPYAYQYKARVA